MRWPQVFKSTALSAFAVLGYLCGAAMLADGQMATGASGIAAALALQVAHGICLHRAGGRR